MMERLAVVRVRVPVKLLAQITRECEGRRGVPLNDWIVDTLRDAVGAPAERPAMQARMF